MSQGHSTAGRRGVQGTRRRGAIMARGRGGGAIRADFDARSKHTPLARVTCVPAVALADTCGAVALALASTHITRVAWYGDEDRSGRLGEIAGVRTAANGKKHTRKGRAAPRTAQRPHRVGALSKLSVKVIARQREAQPRAAVRTRALGAVVSRVAVVARAHEAHPSAAQAVAAAFIGAVLRPRAHGENNER